LATTSATVKPTTAPRLFTRAEALAVLRVGETTLFWLQRTGKLKTVNIGRRVLFNSGEIERIARQGATLTEGEKQAARSHHGQPRKAAASVKARQIF
jgi:hypothetical protein